jgi:hypothetical protein
VLLNDYMLFVVRIVGNRLPEFVQRGARTFNELLNFLIAVIGYIWIHWSCRPAAGVCSSNMLMNADCSKTVALALCVTFALSIYDRFSTVFIYRNYWSSFSSRMGESGGVVIAWQLVGEREGLAPLFVALLCTRRARFALPRISKYVCGFLRFSVFAIAFNALGANCNTVSQKASVGILISTFLLSSSCPQERVVADVSSVSHTDTAPPPLRRRKRRALERLKTKIPITFLHLRESTRNM